MIKEHLSSSAPVIRSSTWLSLKRGTGNREMGWGTGNGERGTGNGDRETEEWEWGTGNGERGIFKMGNL